MAGSELQTSIDRLDALTRRLRRDCPWDREQDERSIVPHTVEEAYELADAAHSGDDAKLLDELGDVLFQVFFLALLLEERGAGDLAAVAEHCVAKLIRRHPHVFGSVEVHDSDEVLRNWDQIKVGERGEHAGLFADMPAGLPALIEARKTQRRAAGAGADCAGGAGVDGALSRLRGDVDRLAAVAVAAAAADHDDRADTRFDAIGDALFATVCAARELGVDPELALRQASARFRDHVSAREGERATGQGERTSEAPT